MKKIVSLVLVVCLFFCLCSCGKKAEQEVLPVEQEPILSVEDIHNLATPSGYTFQVVSGTDVIEEGEYTYAEEDTVSVVPENIASEEIVSSAIEDDMVYTLVNVVLDDGTEYSVLYITEPETNVWVACNVECNGMSTLYTFVTE